MSATSTDLADAARSRGGADFDFSSPTWTERQAAAYLGLSLPFLQHDRCREVPKIPFCRFGRAIRYRAEDVKRYRESCLVGVPAAAE